MTAVAPVRSASSQMMSKILHTVLGFLIVFSTLVGGMIAAGIFHDLLTADIDIFYMIWLWVGFGPFWWLGVRTLATERIEHPTAWYLAFLPFGLLMHMLISWLGPGNPWLLPAILIAGSAYFAIAKRISHVFAR